MKISFKKMAVSALALLLALSMTACSKGGEGEESSSESSGSSAQLPEFDYMSEDLSKYVTLGQYKGFELSIPQKDVITDDDVELQIEYDLIASKITEKVTDRAVTKDDTVSISYKGFLDGVQFEGGTGDKDYFTIYDGGGFIDGFAEGLVGAMPGVETDLNLKFPDSYHSADLAGKAVVFKVTVHHIYVAKELTDAVAASLTGKSDMTADTLRKEYREKLEANVDYYYDNYKISLAWEKILANAKEIELPKDLIEAYYEADIQYYKSYAAYYGMTLEAFLKAQGLTEDSIYKDVRDAVFSEMVIYSIIKAENISLTEEEYKERLKEYAESSGYSESTILAQYTKDELWEMFIYSKAFETIITWQTYTVTEKEVEFDFMAEDLTRFLVLGQYKGLSVSVPAPTPVTDDEVMQTINDSFMNYKICKTVTDRAVTDTDVISISYKGFMNGEQFTGGTGDKDYFTVYDGGGFIPGFAQGLVGAMPGEEIAVSLTFPEDYYEDLAGKAVTFMVTVHHIYVPAELTDENAVKLTGDKEMTAEKLVFECRKSLEEEAAEQYMIAKADLVIKEIIKNAQIISAPEELVEKYYNTDVEYYQYYAEYYGMTYEQMLEYVGMTDSMLRERAESNVMKDITVYSVIKAENISLSDEEYDKRLDEMSESTGYDKETLEQSYTKEALVEQFTYNMAYEMLESWQNIIVVTE